MSTDGRTDGHGETSIPPYNFVAGGIKTKKMSNTDPTKKLGVNSDILDVNIIEEYSCQIMVSCSIFSLFKLLDNQKFYSDISHWKIFKHLIIKMIKQRDNTAVCTKNH